MTMIALYNTVDSPFGPVSVATTEDGAVLALRFEDGEYRQTLASSLERHGYALTRDATRTGDATHQVREFFSGERTRFDLPLAPQGTPFQREVWSALAAIPYGETRTYGRLAAALGRPGAARAVGRANATNPIPLIVPCHRVVGAGGALTGFLGGLQLKERLLLFERDGRSPV